MSEAEKLSEIVEMHGVTRHYPQGDEIVRALDGVDLSLLRGEFSVLFGPSGSGKSTALHLIGGLDMPTSGEITVAGQQISELSATEQSHFRLHHIGFIFQSFNLVPVLSAIENVEFVMQLQGVSRVERREKAYSILEQVGLKDLAMRRPHQLSGGQQQRVAVARAIVSKPEIVLADEPTANLDSKTSESLLELMLQLNEDHEITFLFSTHHDLVMKSARRLIGLQDGKVVSDVHKKSGELF